MTGLYANQLHSREFVGYLYYLRPEKKWSNGSSTDFVVNIHMWVEVQTGKY